MACFEGNGLIVSWCVGHLVSPMDAAGYDLGYKKWKYDDLPILPEPFRYVLAKGKEDAFQNLKHLMEREDVTELVNACDAGREGELIFRLVYEAAGCSKTLLPSVDLLDGGRGDPGRASLTCAPAPSMTRCISPPSAARKPTGSSGSTPPRLFSVLYHRTLNVGRVQTPTLAMLVDRDSKITMFRKEKVPPCAPDPWAGAEAVSEKIAAPEEAEALRAACAGAEAVCASVHP